ncbi:MAG TPA: TolC family protein [Phycisphaerales bacterium]|nr:TolC family protein [Phycisphaerales bacterium]
MTGRGRPRRRLAAAAMVGAIAGCAVDEGAEVAAYRDVLERGLDQDARAPSVHGPLTVVDTMRLVNARYEPLSIGGEDYLQSLIEVRRAAAAFLPVVSLSPSYRWEENTGGDDSPAALDTAVGADIDLNPVADMARVRQRRAAAGQTRALLLDLQDTVLLDAARAHYEVLRAERAVRVLESSLQLQRERVADARGRLEVGVVRPLDASLVESQAAQTAVDLIAAQNAVATGRSLLGFLTAEPLGGVELVDELGAPAAAPGPLPELWALAEARRQDVLAAEQRIVGARRAVESAYGEYFPRVSLGVQAFLQRDSEPTDLDIAGVISLSLPLFSAGLIEADVRTALSQLRQAKLDEALTRRAARRDVEIAGDNLRYSAERESQLRVQERVAQEALNLAEAAFQVGLGTNLERVEAQDRLLSTQLQLVNAEFDRKIAHLDLLRTTGRLHELLGLERASAGPATGAGEGG